MVRAHGVCRGRSCSRTCAGMQGWERGCAMWYAWAMGVRRVLVAVLLIAVCGLRASGALREYPSPAYVLHTDLPEAEAREARVRMTRMAAEYRRRTAAFSDKVPARLPFYLYKDAADY